MLPTTTWALRCSPGCRAAAPIFSPCEPMLAAGEVHTATPGRFASRRCNWGGNGLKYRELASIGTGANCGRGEAMTESEWLASTDPSAMLNHLKNNWVVSLRSLRLFVSACYRRIWDRVPEVQVAELRTPRMEKPVTITARRAFRLSVEMTEKKADGDALTAELDRFQASLRKLASGGDCPHNFRFLFEALSHLFDDWRRRRLPTPSSLVTYLATPSAARPQSPPRYRPGTVGVS
jgi:hypothetical protein